ncbi:hypothetical protein DMX11_13075 [Pseudomonas sp. LB-090624]|uniref:hypothetical protein n=1 Tax=Pseudomonas sp. LB-090624 TaxID=2213079 RepID=UPI000D8EC4B4|nr:hypothetical protein [Pseudomonas sp. LB-090624]PYB75774.1 hypothetical protein DMX11_13075 [Pseudomonas sp. LB-090624]
MITPADYPVVDTQSRSGVSWAAIFAGAAAAASVSLILVVLGAGLGFAATSPWADEGASAKALGVSTIVWLLVTQIIASGLGGYIAGRLRVKWANLHGDEVYFRDTAHGFLSWAVATLVAAMLILGAAGNLVGAGASAASQAATVSAAAGASSATGSDNDSMGYFVDSLFRGDGPAPVSEDAANSVAARILAKGIAGDGALPAEDRAYLAQLVAQRTRLTQAEAEARVDQVMAQVQQLKTDAKQAAETATKVAAWTALWTFVALLCGAFFASLAALYGGRLRDRVQWVEGDYVTHRTVQR